MKSFVLAAMGLIIIPIFLSAPLRANEWNKKTFVTFNTPVEVAGRVLPPGTYVFKLPSSTWNRNIVQIFDKTEQHLYTTMMTAPAFRQRPSGKTVLTLEERPAGSPLALHSWFYPSDNYGQRFIYPSHRERR